MNRRHFLALQAAAVAGSVFADTPRVQSLDDVLYRGELQQLEELLQ